MKKLILFASLMLNLLMSIPLQAYNNRFDSIVIFGDSLSDNGNLYRYFFHLLPVSPPYYEGRFTNGLLWVEYLYQHYFPADYAFGLKDYAVGGAGAVLSYKENLPYTLSSEIDDYFYWHPYKHNDTSLYVVWIGANNYLNAPTNVDEITSRVVDAIARDIERLIARGGNKFLIVNLPDLGKLPKADANNTALLTQLTVAHNEKLNARVAALKEKYPDDLFMFFDSYSLLQNSVTDAQQYGITNTTDACYLGGYAAWLKTLKPSDALLTSYLQQTEDHLSLQQISIIHNNPELREAVETAYNYSLMPEQGKEQALNCDGYLFWDHVHPTTNMHQIIAQKADELIDNAGLIPTWTEDETKKGS